MTIKIVFDFFFYGSERNMTAKIVLMPSFSVLAIGSFVVFYNAKAECFFRLLTESCL